MLTLIDEAKRSSRGRKAEICIQRRKASVRIRLKNHTHFLIFKDFFVEEQRIWSSKKTKSGIS